MTGQNPQFLAMLRARMGDAWRRSSALRRLLIALTPQQQAWLQAWQAQQHALLQANQQKFMQAQPWRQPGYTQYAGMPGAGGNPLLSRAQIPLVTGADTMSDYFLGMMGTTPSAAEDTNPMLMHMLLSGSMGYNE